MRKTLCLALAVSFPLSLVGGCGSTPATETLEFKPTDTSPFDQMKNEMTKGLTKKGAKPIAAPKN